ncbi:MAG: sulfotransferase [Kaiparowitsia implicata GSE-PSE-MK54-09C]|jgi:regulator of replication initiation timing|nr:sulfotransferase [Kaiparowitsia implicata GSE-PSE-MK54-09C]
MEGTAPTLDTAQPAVIITGMHRSGTSFFSALLQSAGLDIGRHLLEARPENPRGYFENVEFLAFHERLLEAQGISKFGWTIQEQIEVPIQFLDKAHQLIQTNSSKTQPWGWKEPRTTLFLNFWESQLPTARFLFIYRKPWEVIDSLYRRGDGVFLENPEFAIDVWTSYNRRLIKFCRQFPEKSLLVHLNQVIDDPERIVSLISNHLSINLHAPNKEIWEPGLLNQSVSTSQRPALMNTYFPEAIRLYEDLNEVSGYEDKSLSLVKSLASQTQSWLIQDWMLLRSQEKQKKNLLSKVQDSESQVQDLKSQIQGLKEQLQLASQALELEKNQTQSYIHQLQQMEGLSETVVVSAEKIDALGHRLKGCQQFNETLRTRLQQKNQRIQRLNHLISKMESSRAWRLKEFVKNLIRL